MRTIKPVSMGIALVMVIAVAPPCFAQYTDMLGQTWNHPLAASMSTQIWNKINEHSITGSYGKRSRGNSSAVQPPPPAIDYGPVVEDTRVDANRNRDPIVENTSPITNTQMNRAVQFRPTGTRLTLQEIINSSGVTEEKKKELKDALLEILNKYEADAATKGYPNDLALALVSFINLNSYVYQGRSDNPNLPAEQTVALRNSIAQNAARTGIFDNLSDRNKQEMYELFVILGGATYQSYQDAKNSKNSEEAKTSKTAAAHNLKLVGIRP